MPSWPLESPGSQGRASSGTIQRVQDRLAAEYGFTQACYSMIAN